MAAARKAKPFLVKRYAGSRLYDATNGCYVTVEQLRGWTAEGIAFRIADTEIGPDITRVLLT